MGLSAGSVIIPGKGTVFTGPPNAVPPVKSTLDPAAPSTYTGWDNLGHTSRDNAVALSKEGGDATNLGSWWDPNLVSNRDAVTWSFTVNALQLDLLTLQLAFPSGRVSGGKFVIPSGGGSTEQAVYILCIDGTKRMGLYFPRASISLGEAPSISTDSFFEIQLAGSLLSATAAVGTDVTIGDLMFFDTPVALVVPAPAVASATPVSATTGTTLTVNGANFTGATTVTVGGTAGTALTVLSPSQLTVTMPSGTAGSAPIVVTTPAGASASYAYTRGGA